MTTIEFRRVYKIAEHARLRCASKIVYYSSCDNCQGKGGYLVCPNAERHDRAEVSS